MLNEHIRPLAMAELAAFVEIMAGAYPGLKIVSDADHQRFRERLATTFEDKSTTIYGFTQSRQLAGGMFLYDFSMNFRGTMMPVGGLGSLAVDLLHRKRKVAKALVSYYLEHYCDRGAPMALLYPFRTDFYRRMGFGYGAKMNRYVFRPHALRLRETKREHIEYLGGVDSARLLDCYDRYAHGTHGMITGSLTRMNEMLTNPALRTVGYVDGGKVMGYLTFDFDSRGHFLKNDLRIKQLVYQGAEVLQELLAFVKSLADQFEWVVFNTHDSSFHHLLDDPRNRADDLIPSVYHESSAQGVGLMYRVIDPSLLLTWDGVHYGSLNVTLKFTLEDSFMPRNRESFIAQFRDGRPSIVDTDAYSTEIKMDVSDFSSMMMGAISLEQLVEYGLSHVSQADMVGEISASFATDKEPICLTAF